jgi:FMN phosphatase YigB (HAD superfamily)
MTPPKAIIFDLDGTLYRMKPSMRPLMTLFAVPRVTMLPRFTKGREAFAGMDLGSRDALMAGICRKLAGGDASGARDTRAWIEGVFYPAFVRTMRFMRGSRPGLVELLQRLRRRGIKLAVVSDYSRVAERLRALCIPPTHFDAIASCEEAGALKPCERAFSDVARPWGFAAAEILVIGDRTDTDGAAATRAGMQFLRITDKQSEGSTWPEVKRRLDDLVMGHWDAQ